MAERIRKTIEDLQIRNDLHVTASIGITIMQLDNNINTIYERVDKAVYISKIERNKISII